MVILLAEKTRAAFVKVSVDLNELVHCVPALGQVLPERGLAHGAVGGVVKRAIQADFAEGVSAGRGHGLVEQPEAQWTLVVVSLHLLGGNASLLLGDGCQSKQLIRRRHGSV